ncbi:MAG: FKBP-type peptidyl-prolyl cis-trans isomerase [Actinomycetaceae bacterium]|nr:FKBP-type peptidyl-prolyl cis-trans isomerase [Actinomycetaceae bacterium]MDU0969385.1 FKBP-type peptidyl-prolyl cis-trans isomerase [Actinomycetaceae bacterium]
MRQKIVAAAAALAILASGGLVGCSNGDDGSAKASGDFPSVQVAKDKTKAPEIGKGSGKAPKKLESRVIREGKGAAIKKTDTVSVDYVGQTWQGNVFDQSYNKTSGPAVFPLEGVIPGWQDGLAGKHVGDRVELVIPPDQAYGDQEQKDASGKVTIPKKSTLVFVVDILGHIDTTDLSALSKAKETGNKIPDWLTISGKLGAKPTVKLKEGAEAPTEQQVIILAEGKGPAIGADDYVAAHVTAVPFGNTDQAVSTWDRGGMQVTQGPVGSSPMYNGIKIGTRALVMTPKGTASNEQAVPAAVYVVDYGAKMSSVRADSEKAKKK